MPSGNLSDQVAEPRRLRLWLIVGVYVLPLVFAWFLLRRGYSRTAREGAFLLAGMSLLVTTVRIVSPY